MILFKCVPISLILAGASLWAQTPTPFIRASGQATVSVQPDLARIDFSVVTQATTAQEASSSNAARVTNLLSQLQVLLGPGADIKTIGYSLSPNYSYPQSGGLPTLLGYTASNTVRVTTSDLSIIGKIIDTGIQAGANQVSSLQFALKDDSAARNQALRLATVQAKTRADAMAAGAGVRTGAYRWIQEGYNVTPVTGGIATMAPTTPIISGLVDVQATVTVEVTLIS